MFYGLVHLYFVYTLFFPFSLFLSFSFIHQSCPFGDDPFKAAENVFNLI